MAAKYRLRLDLCCAKSAVKCLRLSYHMSAALRSHVPDDASENYGLLKFRLFH